MKKGTFKISRDLHHFNLAFFPINILVCNRPRILLLCFAIEAVEDTDKCMIEMIDYVTSRNSTQTMLKQNYVDHGSSSSNLLSELWIGSSKCSTDISSKKGFRNIFTQLCHQYWIYPKIVINVLILTTIPKNISIQLKLQN